MELVVTETVSTTAVSPVEPVLLSEEERTVAVVGIVIVLLDVVGTDDADEVLLLTPSVVDVLGVVVGADGKADDSEAELVDTSDDDKLLLDELSEESTELLLLDSEEVIDTLLVVAVVSLTTVEEDFLVVSVGTTIVLDLVL